MGGNGGSGFAGMAAGTAAGQGGTHNPAGARAANGAGAANSGVVGFANGSGLPVELLSFTGRPEAEGVRLEWSTATEHNSAGFRIHRSPDAFTWEQVAQTAAAGESQSTIHYTALDRMPLPGLAYYQLEQFDLDGAAITYPMIAVNWEHTKGLGSAPNPANDHVILTATEDQPMQVTLTDAMGRTVLKIALSAGERSVPLSDIPSGAYRMLVTGASGELLRTTIVVQH